jgi:hypothetical protein
MNRYNLPDAVYQVLASKSTALDTDDEDSGMPVLVIRRGSPAYRELKKHILAQTSEKYIQWEIPFDPMQSTAQDWARNCMAFTGNS